MKAIAFGITFFGVAVAYGMVEVRRNLTPSENASACVLLLITFIAICLS